MNIKIKIEDMKAIVRSLYFLFPMFGVLLGLGLAMFVNWTTDFSTLTAPDRGLISMVVVLLAIVGVLTAMFINMQFDGGRKKNH